MRDERKQRRDGGEAIGRPAAALPCHGSLVQDVGKHFGGQLVEVLLKFEKWFEVASSHYLLYKCKLK